MRTDLRQFGVLAALVVAGCDTRASLPNDLSSFAVQAEDRSGQAGNFPLAQVKIHVAATALDQLGNPLRGYYGHPYVYVTPGQVMKGEFAIASSPEDEPQLSFDAGFAEGDIYAEHVFGQTAVWVEDRETLLDGGAPDGGYYATGVSDPDLEYGYPLLADLQITPDNTEDPLENNYVVLDQSKTRCIAPPPAARGAPLPDGAILPDGGCAPEYQYQMDLIVTAVQSDGFYAADRNSYYLDGGVLVPKPGWDPGTGAYDLPGSWAYIFVYNYDAPDLFIGNRLVALSGTLGEFVGDTQLDYPAWTMNPDPQFVDPHPQDAPPPVPVNPQWCLNGGPGDHLADQYLCAPSTSNLQFESLESALITAQSVTMPSRWLNCDVTGTGNVPYRKAAGCLPSTSSSFCGEPGAAIAHCPDGTDCVANECATRCVTTADCNPGGATALTVDEQQECIDGHCLNACLCREYCDSMIDCSEQSEYTSYGQYDGWIPGVPEDGGYGHPWKLSLMTRSGAPSLSPTESAGMVLDVTGMLVQVRASDPMWEVVPRVDTDICCHQGSPGCPGPDGGVAVPICPQPTAQ